MVITSGAVAARPGRRIVDGTSGFYQLLAVAVCRSSLPCRRLQSQAVACRSGWGDIAPYACRYW